MFRMSLTGRANADPKGGVEKPSELSDKAYDGVVEMPLNPQHDANALFQPSSLLSEAMLRKDYRAHQARSARRWLNTICGGYRSGEGTKEGG